MLEDLLITIVIFAVLYWIFMSSYSQFFGVFPYKIATSEKVVALTFDDGPNQPYTSQLLDYLDSKDVKATFFQVGLCINKYPEITRRAYEAGHVIGNHSLSHKFSKYFTEPNFVNEISLNQDIIKNVIGKTPILFRPPWLFRTPFIFRTIRRIGLKPISGVFGHNLEVFQPSALKMANHVINTARPGSIIIFHDGFDAKGGDRSQTVAAVKIIVEGLSEKGYSFVTVDKLFNINAYM